VGLAGALQDGPLSQPPGTRRPPEPERLERYSVAAAAARIQAAYDELLGIKAAPQPELERV